MKIDKLIETLLSSGAHRATYYKSPKEIIRATRQVQRTKSGKRAFHKTLHDIRLTIGRPNARESEFIKDCLVAGVSFPVRKPQLSFLRAG